MSDTETDGHTPEPWLFSNGEIVCDNDDGHIERGSVIVMLPNYPQFIETHVSHDEATRLRAIIDEMITNGRLIARAPEMAAELDRLRAVNAQMREALKHAEAILCRSLNISTNANGEGPNTSTYTALGKVRAAIAAAERKACARCGQPSVTNLDGDELCQEHADAWVRAERDRT